MINIKMIWNNWGIFKIANEHIYLSTNDSVYLTFRKRHNCRDRKISGDSGWVDWGEELIMVVVTRLYLFIKLV